MPDAPVDYSNLRALALPDGRVVFSPKDWSDSEIMQSVGYTPPPAPAPSDQTSALGVGGRGVVRGIIPALGGIATGAATGAALSSWSGPGAILGGIAGGIVGGYGASKAQDAVFQAAPGFAASIGQSPEQQQTDMREHPYAAAIGEAVPNLAAFRPSLSAFGRLAGTEAGSVERAGIIAARTNAGIGAGLGGGMEAYNQSQNPDGFDWSKVALQTGLGSLAQKETRLGRGITGAVDRVLPEGMRSPTHSPDQNDYLPNVTVDGGTPSPVDTSSPTDLLRLPDYSGRDYRRGSVQPDSDNSVLHSDPAGRTNFSMSKVIGARNDAFKTATSDDFHQPDLFNPTPLPGSAPDAAPAAAPVVDNTAPHDLLGGQSADQAPANAPDAQTKMFYLEQGDILGSIKEQTGREPDGYTIKLSKQLSDVMGSDSSGGFDAQRLLDQHKADLETAKIKPEAIAARQATLDAAQKVIDSRNQQGLGQRVDDALARPPSGVDVTSMGAAPPPVDPSAPSLNGDLAGAPPPAALTGLTQPSFGGGAGDGAGGQAAPAPDPHAEAVRTGDIRQHALSDILLHSDPKNVVPDFLKFVTSGKGQYGETALRPEEQALLSQARDARIKRRDFKTALDDHQARIDAEQQRREAGAQRRQDMEQRFQLTKAEKEAKLIADRNGPAKGGDPAVAPVSQEPVPTLDELMARSQADKTAPPDTVLSNTDGPQPEVKTAPPEAAVPEPAPHPEEPAPVEHPEDAPVTYESVMKEAEGALASDGESGALKPKEVQQLGILAEQGKVSPEELRSMMHAAMDKNASHAYETATAGRSDIGGPRANRPTGDRSSDPSSVLRVADVTGSTNHVLDHIIKHGTREESATARMMRDISPNVRVEVHDPDRVARDWNEHYPGSDGSKTAAYYDPKTDTIVVSSNYRNPTGAIFHELAHALTIHETRRNSALGQEFETIYNKYAAMEKARLGVDDLGKAFDEGKTAYGLTHYEEFIAEVWANQDFRNKLADMQEAKAAQGKDGNLLQQFVAVVKQALSKVLGKVTGADAAWQDVMKVVQLTADSAHSRVDIEGGPRPAGLDSRPAPLREAPVKEDPEKAIAKLPPQAQGAARTIYHTLASAVRSGVDHLASTSDIVEMIKDVVPSAKTYDTTMMQKVQIREALESKTNDLVQKFRGLKSHLQNTGKGTVNSVIQDIGYAGEWAFQPHWLDKAVPINADLKAKFDALPHNAQEIVKGVFEQNHSMLLQKKEQLAGSVNSIYDKLIETTTDAAAKAQLVKDKAAALSQSQRVLSMPEDMPYASRRRYGDYVLVGKSPEMEAAIENGASNDAIEKMKQDETHYYVNRFETMAEAEHMRAAIVKSGVYDLEHIAARPADQVADHLVGGKEMMAAFQRLREYIQTQAPNMNASEPVINAVSKLAADLQLSAMASTSARKSEMRTLKIGGGDLDMMRNFVTQGRADAHLIAAMAKNDEVLAAITNMRKEAGAARGEAAKTAMHGYNEMMLRHLASMDYRPSDIANFMKSATSFFMLQTSPAYYLQNATQPFLMSAPYMAGKHGWVNAMTHMTKGYGEIGKIWGETPTGPLDISKLADPETRRAVQALSDLGAIDIGADKEMGEFRSLSAGPIGKNVERGTTFLRNLTRKSEAINRVATGIAAYRLEINAGATHEAAVDYAARINRVTHGTYDGYNAPRFMRGPVGSVLTQFRKFQLMQASLLVRMAHGALHAPDPVDRAIARRSMLWVLGHTAVSSGMLGLPGASAIVWAVNKFMSTENEPADIEQQIHNAIGDNATANLLLKGVPAIWKWDLSGRLGMGQTFSLLPFTDPGLDQNSYAKTVLALTGPAIGGVGAQVADALDQMRKPGQFYRGMETMMPAGVHNAMRAYREASGGVTKRSGETLVKPEEVTFGDTFARLIGLSTTVAADRNRKTSDMYSNNAALKDNSKTINQVFATAYKNGDAAGMAAARDQFKEMQDVRVKEGLKRQSAGQLMKFVRERQQIEKATVEGVEYKPRSQQLRNAEAEAQTDPEE